MNELLLQSALTLADRIRRREVSPVDVVEAHVDRALVVNRHINAIVHPLYDRASEMARQAEKRLMKDDDLPPFFGVPCSVKEAFAIEGGPWTGGVHSRRNHIATENATVVDRMLEAGGIPLGSTNVPEGCMWYETYNTIYGRTSNPHDVRRIAGGSSGGEGAIIGSGASPFGVGSDIGGSIRMPCHFNGIAGHKPSPGLVPGSGQFPWDAGPRTQYAVAGPMARTVADVEALLEIYAGPDGIDPSIHRGFERLVLEDPTEVKVYYFEEGEHASSPAQRRAVRKAVRILEDRGLTVESYHPPFRSKWVDIWTAAIEVAGGEEFCGVLGEDGRSINPWAQLMLWALRRSPHTYPALLLAAGETLSPLVAKRMERVAEKRLPMKLAIEETLGPRGVLICPTFPSVAPRHDAPLLRPMHWIACGIFNVLELPSTCVPIDRDDRDLPTSVQVVGCQENDGLTLAIGKILEEDTEGWRPGRGLHAV